jgi:hypothetical protein
MSQISRIVHETISQLPTRSPQLLFDLSLPVILSDIRIHPHQANLAPADCCAAYFLFEAGVRLLP